MEEKNLLSGINEEDINEVLAKYTELFNEKKQYEQACEQLKTKVKIFLKEKKWNNYKHEEISVTITRIERQTIDKDKLKLILTKPQLESISKFNVSERVLITTKKQRDRMKGFLNG